MLDILKLFVQISDVLCINQKFLKLVTGNRKWSACLTCKYWNFWTAYILQYCKSRYQILIGLQESHEVQVEIPQIIACSKGKIYNSLFWDRIQCEKEDFAGQAECRMVMSKLVIKKDHPITHWWKPNWNLEFLWFPSSREVI